MNGPIKERGGLRLVPDFLGRQESAVVLVNFVDQKDKPRGLVGIAEKHIKDLAELQASGNGIPLSLVRAEAQQEDIPHEVAPLLQQKEPGFFARTVRFIREARTGRKPQILIHELYYKKSGGAVGHDLRTIPKPVPPNIIA